MQGSVGKITLCQCAHLPYDGPFGIGNRSYASALYERMYLARQKLTLVVHIYCHDRRMPGYAFQINAIGGAEVAEAVKYEPVTV